ncbi:MAG: histidine kinase dimerization/phospho-acceptor domain-containing protein [Eggerthellaceae bacterium]
MAINQSGLAEFLWDTPAGLAKCLIAGFAGVAVFIAGLWRASRRSQGRDGKGCGNDGSPRAVAVLALGSAVFAVRCALLKRSLRRANGELAEIVRGLEDNRIVKLPQPDKDLEALLGTVNHALAAVREQGVAYARHEAELKAQVESISHDLRTPLTAIVGYLALLDEEGMDADTRASLATVRRKADALQRLIAQFYELSQARNEDAPLACEPVEAGRLVRESVAGRYRLFEERGLEVRLRVPDRPVRVRGDEGALERVVENLVHNAGKYARSTFDVEGGPRRPRDGDVRERCRRGVLLRGRTAVRALLHR